MTRTARTSTRHAAGAVATTVLAALGLANTVEAANSKTMVCYLRGTAEVPANASPARGCGRFQIDTNANTITYRITYGGLTAAETAAHFHGNAPPGVAAGVKIALPPGNPKVGVVTYVEADEASILKGDWYVNIHTVAFPGGEIRGQVNSFAAHLDAPQENPANATTSTGWATANVDTCANTLTYYVFVDSLSAAETAAHIHGVANIGTNAGVLVPIPPGMIKAGVWNYPENLEPALLNGLMYFNVHTTANPGGEIRGQISNMISPIDSMQETPPLAIATAAGCGCHANDPLANTLGYYLFYGGLTSAETAAHIHGFAPPGIAAGVLIPYPAGSPKKGVWVYGAANTANVRAGLTYSNIHTVANGGGEIRGQILFPIPKCLGDVNCTRNTDIDDLLVVINGWGPCPAPPAPCPQDTDYNGATDIDDLLNIINSWGKCP